MLALMQIIDQIHQVLWGAIAAGRGIIAGALIAPGTIEGMLHHRQKFDMRKTQARDVFGQLGCQLTIGQMAVPFLGHAHPRSQVHLINCHGAVSAFLAWRVAIHG